MSAKTGIWAAVPRDEPGLADPPRVGVIAPPITYRGPDGKQYVAVVAGVGGWSGQIVSLGLDPRDLSAANGWGNAMKELPNRTQPGGFLYVSALP